MPDYEVGQSELISYIIMPPVFLFKNKGREEIASVLARAHSPLKSVKNSLFLSQNNLPVTSTILPNKPVDFTSVWCLELGS